MVDLSNPDTKIFDPCAEISVPPELFEPDPMVNENEASEDGEEDEAQPWEGDVGSQNP